MKTGRPKGSGARTIKVVTRPGAGPTAYWLIIGRALWQAIGEPAYVQLVRDGRGGISIVPADADDSYTIHGPKQNSIPRIACGNETLEWAGLYLGNEYPAHVNQGKIYIPSSSL